MHTFLLAMKRTSQMSIKLVKKYALIHLGYVHTIPDRSCCQHKKPHVYITTGDFGSIFVMEQCCTAPS